MFANDNLLFSVVSDANQSGTNLIADFKKKVIKKLVKTMTSIISVRCSPKLQKSNHLFINV